MINKFSHYKIFSGDFIILILVAFISNFTYLSTSIFLSLFTKKIGISVYETGFIISALTLGAVIGGPIWGKFVDRTGKRKLTLLISVIGQGIFCLLTPFISGFVPLIIMRFFLGLFWVAQAPILNEIIIKEQNIKIKNSKLSWINIIRGISSFFAISLSGFLNDIDEMLIFFLSGLISLSIIYPIFLLQGVDGTIFKTKELKIDKKWILKLKNLFFYLPMFLRLTAVNGFTFFLPLFWKDKGISTTFAGIVLGTSFLIQLAFFPIVGKICSRKPNYITKIVQLGYTFTIIPFIVAPYLYRGTSVFIPQSVLSISWVFFYIGSTLLLGEIAPHSQRTEALGWMETAFNLGGTIGPIAFSLVLAESSNNYLLSFLSFSLLVFSALIIFSSYERRYHKS